MAFCTIVSADPFLRYTLACYWGAKQASKRPTNNRLQLGVGGGREGGGGEGQCSSELSTETN